MHEIVQCIEQQFTSIHVINLLCIYWKNCHVTYARWFGIQVFVCKLEMENMVCSPWPLHEHNIQCYIWHTAVGYLNLTCLKAWSFFWLQVPYAEHWNVLTALERQQAQIIPQTKRTSPILGIKNLIGSFNQNTPFSSWICHTFQSMILSFWKVGAICVIHQYSLNFDHKQGLSKLPLNIKVPRFFWKAQCC